MEGRLRLGKVVAIMVLFTLILGVLMIGMPIVRADTEPNNDFGQAETVTVGSHVGSVDGTTDPNDYYKITVGAGQTLSVGVVPGSALSVALYLYDPARSQVIFDVGWEGEIVNATWTTNSEQTSYQYYIRLEVWSGGGVYTMDVSLASQNDAGSGGDAGDTFEAATTIASANGTYSGFLRDRDINDYYKLNVAAGRTLSVEVTPSTDLGVGIYFYDGARVQKAFNAGGSGVVVESFWTTNSEQPSYLYYVRIEVWSGGGVYTMDASLAPQNDAGSGGDAGDTLETATEIAAGTHTGFLRDADTYDCYKTFQRVTAGRGIYVKVTPASTLGIGLWGYDEDKVQRAFNVGAEGQVVYMSVSIIPETGIYYLKVEIWSGSGTYSMLVSIEPTVGTPTQVPPAENVQPDQAVTVSASVTSLQNTVSAVQLWYSKDGGTWTSTTMTYNVGTGLYDGTIPGSSGCTWVSYKIKAYNDKGDYFEETNAGAYYVYHVIPEFPSAIIPPLLMMITLLAIILGKKLHSAKSQNKGLTTT